MLSTRLSPGLRRPAVLAAALCAAALMAPAGASAAATCAFSAASATVTVTVSSGTAKVHRTGNAIAVDSVNCPGGASVLNTDLIKIVGSGVAAQNVTLSLVNGPMAPGKTAEAGAGVVSEIEVQVQLGLGFDYFSIEGSSAIDRFTLGTLGANLNADTDGNDVVWSGNEGLMSVYGLAGNDNIQGAGGAGTGSPIAKVLYLMGGIGADTLVGGSRADQLFGDANVAFGPPVAAGNDTMRGGEAGDVFYGQTGNDVMEGDRGADRMYLEAGNDTMRGGDDGDAFSNISGAGVPDGADVIAGGRGTDFVDLNQRTAPLVITLDNVANDGADTNVPADGVANEADNIMGDVEQFYLGHGDDRLDADLPVPNAAEAANQIYGFNGNDIVRGGEGNDQIIGDAGNDQIFGGPGNDNLDGNTDIDIINGGDGDDNLDGGVGADSTSGEAGDDYMYQEAAPDGADLVSGGTGRDTGDYGSRSTNVRILLDNIPVAGVKGNDGADVDQNGVAEEGDDVRADVEVIYTGSGNDLLNANLLAANNAGAENNLEGGLNNDRIEGGTGDDRLRGSVGNDELIGGNGEDLMPR